jgi:hypothetical protein
MPYKFIFSFILATVWSGNCIADGPQSTPNVATAPQEIGMCVGRGGLNNLAFWGAVGSTCNGLIEWGRFEKPASLQVKEICACKSSKPNVNGVTFWGPKGEPCMGSVSEGSYVSSCKPIESIAIASCVGRGGVTGQRLYGPKGSSCGGFDNWGPYE